MEEIERQLKNIVFDIKVNLDKLIENIKKALD